MGEAVGWPEGRDVGQAEWVITMTDGLVETMEADPEEEVSSEAPRFAIELCWMLVASVDAKSGVERVDVTVESTSVAELWLGT